MSELDQARELSADICVMFQDREVPPHIGSGALALVIGAMAAHTNDPEAYMKNIMELCHNVIEHKRSQEQAKYN